MSIGQWPSGAAVLDHRAVVRRGFIMLSIATAMTDIPSTSDARRAPATARNRDPILALLRAHLPDHGMVLEVASGTGEHVVHFAAAMPTLTWQPTDPSADARSSIAAWTRERALANVLPPLDLDAASARWPVDRADAMVCINMVHISPWSATEGLLGGAGRLLPVGGLLYLYGPFRRAGIATAPSNEAFDRDLRRRDAAWGLREVEAVESCAASHGLHLDQLVEMPANNLSAMFRKRHKDQE